MKSTFKIFTLWVTVLSFCLGAHSTEKSLSLVESCNTQGITLFYTLPRPSNELISPFSIYTSLLMAYAGSKGGTAKQFANVLNTHFNQNQAALAFSKLYSDFSTGSENNGFNLFLASGIWIDSTFSILPSFLKTIEKDFNATIKNIQFSNTSKALQTINKSIEEETNHYIRDFLSNNALSSATKMLFTNVLFLKGSWEHPFPTEQTEHQSFFKSKNDKTDTIMMNQTSMLPYYENKTTQVLSLPIKSTQKDTTFSLVIFLPKAYPSSPLDFYYQDSSNPLKFLNDLGSLDDKKVHVTIPKFEMSQKIEISKVLKELGVTAAFTSEADFSSISEGKDLSIGKVLSQSALSINETGIFAAASSGISLDIQSSLDTSKPIRFNANHPFLFALVEMQSKLIFFIGEYLIPSTEKVES